MRVARCETSWAKTARPHARARPAPASQRLERNANAMRLEVIGSTRDDDPPAGARPIGPDPIHGLDLAGWLGEAARRQGTHPEGEAVIALGQGVIGVEDAVIREGH